MFAPRAWMIPALAVVAVALLLQPARAAGDTKTVVAHIKLSGNPDESAPACTCEARQSLPASA